MSTAPEWPISTRAAATPVFQHGQPASSYVWRNVMPHLEGLGRLVACDLVGMGASDKLSNTGPASYSLAEHAKYLFALWDALDLGERIVLVLDDWGAALGFWWAPPVSGAGQGDRPHGGGRRSDEPLRPSRAGAPALQGASLACGRGDGASAEHFHGAGAETCIDPHALAGGVSNTIAGHSWNPAKAAGQPCPSRETFRSTANRRMRWRRSPSWRIGCRAASICRSCSFAARPASLCGGACSRRCEHGRTRSKLPSGASSSFRRTVPKRWGRRSPIL